MTAALLDAALRYARRGFVVFPLHYPVEQAGQLWCSCASVGCSNSANAAKHPYARLAPNGLKNATTDITTIKRWWAGAPFNIGLATGAVSGVVVVDVDPRHGGDETLAILDHEYGELPPTWRFLTGSGGEHILFRHSGRRVQNDAGSRLGKGLDVRGDGGYIVTPPSLHISGRRYAVSVDHHPDHVPLANLPPWLIARLVVAPSNKGPAAAMPETWRKLVTEGVNEGRRNEAITRLAGHLLRRRIDPFVALDLVKCWNLERCRPPLREEEITGIVDRIAARELHRRGGQ